jgi:Type ISP C-terminal specificity domain
LNPASDPATWMSLMQEGLVKLLIRPNLNPIIVHKIADILGLRFSTEKLDKEDKDSFAPIDLLDYIYAFLHSPSYREAFNL